MEIMKHTALPLLLLVSTPASAQFQNCKTIADDVAYQDQLLKKQAQEFSDRYGETNNPGIAASQDYVGRLDALISTLRRDIDGLRWLVAHHCGPAKEEPNAIKSVRDMEINARCSSRTKNGCAGVPLRPRRGGPRTYFLGAVSGKVTKIGRARTATTAIMAPGTMIQPVRSVRTWAT